MDKKDKINIIIIFLVIAILCGVGIYYMNKKEDEKKSKKKKEYYQNILEKTAKKDAKWIEGELSNPTPIVYTDYLLNTQYRDSGIGYKIEYPTDMFERIQRVKPDVPNEEDVNRDIKQKYSECVTTGKTVQACLTESNAGLKPMICKELCQQTYGKLSPVCTKICNDQQRQQRNSCAFGPC